MESLLHLAVRLFEWAFGRFRNRIVIKRLLGARDKDLDAAARLYARRLPENERDTFENIVRWQEEYQIAPKDVPERYRDYLLVAKAAGEVCGLFYGQYYPRTRLFAVSYLVSDKNSPQRKDGAIVSAILDYLFRLLRTEAKECLGIVFELEDPKHCDDPRRAQKCRGREKHFRGILRRRGLVVKQLEIDYRQPRLSLWDQTYEEEPQLLVYGRIQPPPMGRCLARADVGTILDTLYNDWYGDCYMDDPEKDAEYRAYLRGLYEETMSGLPEQVPLA